MILWIFIVVFAVSLVMLAIEISTDRYWPVIGFISTVFLVLSGILSFVFGAYSISISTGEDGMLVSMQEKREALVYQLENDIYDNDNDLGKKELYSEITEYNCEIAEGKIMQDNIWVYNLYPNIYDDLELIELPEN